MRSLAWSRRLRRTQIAVSFASLRIVSRASVWAAAVDIVEVTQWFRCFPQRETSAATSSSRTRRISELPRPRDCLRRRSVGAVSQIERGYEIAGPIGLLARLFAASESGWPSSRFDGNARGLDAVIIGGLTDGKGCGLSCLFRETVITGSGNRAVKPWQPEPESATAATSALFVVLPQRHRTAEPLTTLAVLWALGRAYRSHRPAVSPLRAAYRWRSSLGLCISTCCVGPSSV